MKRGGEDREGRKEGRGVRRERKGELYSLHGNTDCRPEGGPWKGGRGLLLLFSLLIPGWLWGTDYLCRIGVGGQLM